MTQEGPGRGGRCIPRRVWAEGRQPPVRGLRLTEVRTCASSRCPQEPLLSRLGMGETQPQERDRMLWGAWPSTQTPVAAPALGPGPWGAWGSLPQESHVTHGTGPRVPSEY